MYPCSSNIYILIFLIFIYFHLFIIILAGAAIGTQVFKPILAALQERTGDDVKAQGYVFIIGSCIAIIAAILSIFFVPDLSKEKMEALDIEFRELLIKNGYDVSQLGVHDNIQKGENAQIQN